MTRHGRTQPPTIRAAVRGDAKRIHELIASHLRDGHLLPRELAELTVHVDRFIVAVDGRGSIVGCGELAPLSQSLAEIRSLVVADRKRGRGIGRRIVGDLRRRAAASGYDELCVFAHVPAYFARMGFSIVPHTWLPEKISTDCRSCALFRQCGQFAMVADLEPAGTARQVEHPLHV